jgi:hypothetical protein
MKNLNACKNICVIYIMYSLTYEPYLDREEYYNYLALIGEPDEYLKTITFTTKRREISPFFRDTECIRFFRINGEMIEYTDSNMIKIITILENNGYSIKYDMTKLLKGRHLAVFSSM